MTEQRLLQIIDEHIRARTPYLLGERDCEWWVRYLFECDGVTFDKNLLIASNDFVLVTGKRQLMDVAVFHNDDETDPRHVGVMIDDRWFTHFSQTWGIAKTEITRYEQHFSHAGRHRKYVS